jgi:hypothetical protein
VPLDTGFAHDPLAVDPNAGIALDATSTVDAMSIMDAELGTADANADVDGPAVDAPRPVKKAAATKAAARVIEDEL